MTTTVIPSPGGGRTEHQSNFGRMIPSARNIFAPQNGGAIFFRARTQMNGSWPGHRGFPVTCSRPRVGKRVEYRRRLRLYSSLVSRLRAWLGGEEGGRNLRPPGGLGLAPARVGKRSVLIFTDPASSSSARARAWVRLTEAKGLSCQLDTKPACASARTWTRIGPSWAETFSAGRARTRVGEKGISSAYTLAGPRAPSAAREVRGGKRYRLSAYCKSAHRPVFT